MPFEGKLRYQLETRENLLLDLQPPPEAEHQGGLLECVSEFLSIAEGI